KKGFGYALGMILKNEKMGGRPFFEHVELRAAAEVTGVIQTPDGKPAAGIKLLAYSVTNKPENGFEYGSFADATTDDKGKFNLMITTPGTAVFWILPEKDYMPSAHAIKEGKRGDLGVFGLRNGITIRGKVLDAKGNAVIGVNVNAEATTRSEELQGLPVA